MFLKSKNYPDSKTEGWNFPFKRTSKTYEKKHSNLLMYIIIQIC